MANKVAERRGEKPVQKSVSRWTVVKTFSCGFIAGVLYIRALRLVQKWRLPSLAKIQASVLPMLRAHQEVRGAVGTSLRPGLLSAVTYSGGFKWKWPQISRNFSYKNALPFDRTPWTVQAIFQVIGDKSTALVTLETLPAAKQRGVTELEFLAVDFNTGERLIVKNSAKQLKIMASTAPSQHLTLT